MCGDFGGQNSSSASGLKSYFFSLSLYFFKVSLLDFIGWSPYIQLHLKCNQILIFSFFLLFYLNATIFYQTWNFFIELTCQKRWKLLYFGFKIAVFQTYICPSRHILTYGTSSSILIGACIIRIIASETPSFNASYL